MSRNHEITSVCVIQERSRVKRRGREHNLPVAGRCDIGFHENKAVDVNLALAEAISNSANLVGCVFQCH